MEYSILKHFTRDATTSVFHTSEQSLFFSKCKGAFSLHKNCTAKLKKENKTQDIEGMKCHTVTATMAKSWLIQTTIFKLILLTIVKEICLSTKQITKLFTKYK